MAEKHEKVSWADSADGVGTGTDGSWADDDENEDTPPQSKSVWSAPRDYDDVGSEDEALVKEYPRIGEEAPAPRDKRSSAQRTSRDNDYPYAEDRGQNRRDRDQGYARERPYGRNYGRDRGYNDRGDRDRGRDYDDDRDSRNYGRDRDHDRGRDRSGEEKASVPFPTVPPWTAYIGNLSYKAYESDVEGLFLDCGCKVHKVNLLTEKDTGQLKGYGYVEFDDAESLRLALTCHDKALLGRPIRVAIPKPKEPRREEGRGWRSARDRDHTRDRDRDYSRDREIERERPSRSPRTVRAHASEEQAKPAEQPAAPRPAPKPKADPFGQAKPRDELEAQKKINELQRQMDEERQKKDEDEKKKKEDEDLKKKQEKEALQKQKEEEEKAKQPPINWRDKDSTKTIPSHWKNSKKQGDNARGDNLSNKKEGGRDNRDHTKDGKRDLPPRSQAKKQDNAARGRGGRVGGGGRNYDNKDRSNGRADRGRPNADTHAGGKGLPDKGKSATERGKTPPTTTATAADNNKKSAPKTTTSTADNTKQVGGDRAPVQDTNSFALLGDEEA